MPRIERFREPAAAVSLELLAERARQGWTLAALEWTREAEGEAEAPAERLEIPYGLRISEDGTCLEEHPAEKRAIVFMLEQIVQDTRISEIARRLNEQGFRTRQLRDWTAPDVFQLLPRLVEDGARTFATDRWAEIRRGLFRQAG